jgi:hypothetical protein
MVLLAKEWGWSPTAVLRGAKNPHKFHPADYNFANAVQTLTDEKCPSCGVPVWHGMASDNSIAFETKTITCYSCAHKAEHEPDPKDRKPGESTVVFAVPELGFDELPSRKAHFEREMKYAKAEFERERAKREKFSQQD